MNKIYLFLLTLFAAVGFNANAAAPNQLWINNWGTSSDVELTKDASNANVFTGEYSNPSHQFRLYDGSKYYCCSDDNRRLKYQTYTLKEGDNNPFLTEGYDGSINKNEKFYLKVDFSGTNPTMTIASTPFTSGGGDTTDALWQYSTSASGTKNTIIADNGVYSFIATVADKSDLYFWLNGDKYMYDASGYSGGGYWVDDSKSSTKLKSIDGYLHFEKYGSAGVAAGTYKFDISKSGSDWYLTVTKNPVVDTTPSQLTLYGYINGSWSSMAGVKNGSKFTFTGVNILKSGDTSGTFRFSAGSSDSSDIYGTTYSYNQQINFSNGATTTSVAFKALGSTVHDYIISNGTYDIVVDFSDNHVYLTKSDVVTPPTPTGSDMYVWFGANWNEAKPMTAQGEWWTFDYNSTVTENVTLAKGTIFFNFSDANNPGSADYWDDAAFDSHRIGNTDDADAVITANGASLSAGTNSGKPYKLAVTAGWTYKIMISKTSPYTVKVTTENFEEDLDLDNKDLTKYWYLSGDINTWSSIVETTGGRSPGKYFYGEDEKNNTTLAYTGTDPQNEGYNTPEWRSDATTYNYRPEAGEDYKRFLSNREMNQQFRFRRVTAADVAALGSYTKADGKEIAENTATTGQDGWWVLDLSKAVDSEGNPARLCGQFKIINGSLIQNDKNYAFDGTNNLTEALEVGKMSNKVAIKKDDNLTIKSTVIENAKIFFTPDNGGYIMVTGEERTLYLYYLDLGSDNATVGCPTPGYKIDNEDRYYNAGKQLNYKSDITANQSQWEQTTMAVAKDDLPESLASLAEGYDSYKVWRLPIHPSLIHRSPMPFTAAIKSAKGAGTEFAPVALHCDNEWFVEGDPVNLYLRYEDDTLTPQAMYCNAYYNRYENGEMVGVRYQHKTYEKMADPANYDDEIPAAYRGYNWFKSGDVTTYFANGGYALFASSRGEMYPLGGINAVGTERARVTLNGVDLFYVIPSSTKLNILYNHLNGTFNISDKDTHNNTIQINAELFQEGHPLFGDHIDFTMDGSVTYRFRVYHLDSTSEEMKKIADSDVTDKPFYDWDVTECGVGYYQVLVTATRGGKTYQAYDVYSIAK